MARVPRRSGRPGLDRVDRLGAAWSEQSRAIAGWLAELPPRAYQHQVEGPAGTIHLVTAALVLTLDRLDGALDQPTSQRPTPLSGYLAQAQRGTGSEQQMISELAAATDGPLLATAYHRRIGEVADRLTQRDLPATVTAPYGPLPLTDLLLVQLIALAVHADDLSRCGARDIPVPTPRAARAEAIRTLTAVLAQTHPGRSIEFRVPPYAAVQLGLLDEGPTHTRGTPPNVVETDAATFLRVAADRERFADARASGRLTASGSRADLSSMFPLWR